MTVKTKEITFNNTLSASDKIALVSNLHTMLASGIPILETVDSLLQDSKGGQKKLLQTLRQDLGQGQHMYVTFAKFPKIFDKVTVSIIKSSEESGTLDTALDDLKLNIRKEIEFNDKIRSALIYPAFILIVFVLVMVVILVVVIPKIATVFAHLNVVLPLPTKIMIFLSDALLTYTIQIIIVTSLLVLATVYLFKRYRIFFVRLLTSLPVVSLLVQQIDLTRFTRSLYLLLTAGIPITVALELTQDVVIKKNISNAIKHAKNYVYSGKKLSEGFKDSKKVIPPIMIKIIEAGERSGSLDKSMLDVSEYLDYQVSNTLKLLTAMIEPIMLVGVGILVGGMMMAIIAPIYQLIGQVGATH
ncbi:MAG TPA: type II secretion system F family protein [Candidatus Sulfotelmatobacter sp.]|jgi:type IV pilus assembly protein PilC|nr:type II secretion system F family protein [Candidatus Sulfotelmatobacter sp.]